MYENRSPPKEKYYAIYGLFSKCDLQGENQPFSVIVYFCFCILFLKATLLGAS